MEINAMHTIGTKDLPKEDLLTYLSQVVLSKTDEEVKRATDYLNLTKGQLSEAKESLKSVKRRLLVLMEEYDRLRVMHEVLRKIDALRREGVIVGQNKIKINNILMNLEQQPLGTLRSLEDRLSAYVPESPKVTFG